MLDHTLVWFGWVWFGLVGLKMLKQLYWGLIWVKMLKILNLWCPPQPLNIIIGQNPTVIFSNSTNLTVWHIRGALAAVGCWDFDKRPKILSSQRVDIMLRPISLNLRAGLLLHWLFSLYIILDHALVWFGWVWFGLVWFGLAENAETALERPHVGENA